MGPSKGSKQPRQSQDQRSRRSNSVDSREEPLVAQVRRPTSTWSPKLEVDGVPIVYDASLRHYRRGHAGLVAEALEQPLLLPKDMEAYRNFNHSELFLSFKRDLATISDCIHFSSFVLLHFRTFYSKGEISLVFVCVLFLLLFFFLFPGHTASFRGRGVGKECTWQDQGCLGCSSRSGGGARRLKGKTR